MAGLKKILLTGILLSLGVVTQGLKAQQTRILTADKHNDYGLVYSLPTTALKIYVTVEKETKVAGPYYQYAKKFLGKTDVVKENSQTRKVADIRIEPVGVNDDNNKYLMQFKPGALAYIAIDPDGMLLAINAEQETASTSRQEENIGKGRGKTMKTSGPRMGVDDYLQYVDMDFVSAQSSIRQAEMIASNLMDVRDAKISLTRGTADNMPVDGRQLELMLNSLRDQEDALSRAFTGYTITEQETAEFLYIPDNEGEEVLFRLSDFEGVVEADDYSGDPVFIKTDIILEPTLPVDVNGVEKKLPKDAVIYSLPGTAKVTLYNSGGKLGEIETEFAQFGKTFGLAPTLFSDKKSPSYAVFSPVTGALLEIGKIETNKE